MIASTPWTSMNTPISAMIAASVRPGIVNVTRPNRIANAPRSASAHQLLESSEICGIAIVMIRSSCPSDVGPGRGSRPWSPLEERIASRGWGAKLDQGVRTTLGQSRRF